MFNNMYVVASPAEAAFWMFITSKFGFIALMLFLLFLLSVWGWNKIQKKWFVIPTVTNLLNEDELSARARAQHLTETIRQVYQWVCVGVSVALAAWIMFKF